MVGTMSEFESMTDGVYEIAGSIHSDVEFPGELDGFLAFLGDEMEAIDDDVEPYVRQCTAAIN